MPNFFQFRGYLISRITTKLSFRVYKISRLKQKKKIEHFIYLFLYHVLAKYYDLMFFLL